MSFKGKRKDLLVPVLDLGQKESMSTRSHGIGKNSSVGAQCCWINLDGGVLASPVGSSTNLLVSLYMQTAVNGRSSPGGHT